MTTRTEYLDGTSERWVEHDGATEWQQCRWCGLRTGAGLTTSHDAAYYAEGHDPADCPRCGGEDCMGIVVDAEVSQ